MMLMGLASAVLAVVAVAVVMRGGTDRVGTITAVVAAAASITVTAATAAGRSPRWAPPEWDVPLLPLLTELGALTVLTARFAHRGRATTAVLGAGATGLATALLVLRLFRPTSWPAGAGACGLWTLAVLAAAAVGLHLRFQDGRRERHAAESLRAQRLRLARDLHDFVAHGVSEMVAGAQAGQVVGADPAQAAMLFQRIEQAGQQALATLDQTVHMLDTPEAVPRAGLEELPALVAGFDAVGPTRAVLDLDPALTGALPDDVSSVAYRTVAEALTNVRRHAPAAPRVSVTVTRTGPDTLTLTVTNRLPTTAPAPPRSAPAGRGLPGLAAAAAAIGGRVEAGPHGADWRLRARLPLRPRQDHGATGGS
ncbi:sensor histidine kinase [Actinomadura sp. WMMA1423]|uniref:sensor histidine kinase n=1 Tax=Actinomadura sp. WMMA1423 TaxID=2591108 RepID=UPI001F0D9790|nr:histidine kinase [Actinomadura sp. WMMA1423]